MPPPQHRLPPHVQMIPALPPHQQGNRQPCRPWDRPWDPVTRRGLLWAGGGPLLCLTGLVVLPWVWGIPTALGVAELATSMPSNGGVLVWVNCGQLWSAVIVAGIWPRFLGEAFNTVCISCGRVYFQLKY